MQLLTRRFDRRFLVLMAAASVAACAPGGEESQSQVSDGLRFDYGLAAQPQTGAPPSSHPDPTMHGGPPVHANGYHLTLSVTDADTRNPIEDAEASVALSGPGHPGAASLRMDAMTVNGRRTFGRYVVLPEEGPYQLKFDVRRPGQREHVSARFSLRRPD